MTVHVARLDAVCEINPRMPRTLADDEAVSFLPMAAVSENGHIEFEEQREASEVKKGYTYFERGDVLIAKITPCFENGKATRTEALTNSVGFGSTEFHVLRASREIDSSYLFHLIWNSKFREVGANNMTGSAGQKRVPADFLKRLEIPLPPLDEQRRIAAILDKADDLRRKRKRAIELLDGLTQSIFLEMFGDESNLVPLNSICFKVTDGTHQAPKWADSGIPFLFVSNVRNQSISFETNKFVSEEEFSRLTKNTPIDVGDVLYTAVGSYGNAAIVETSDKFVFQRHIAQLKPLQTKVSPFYLSVALESPKVKAQADKLARGVAQKTVTLDSLKKFLIPLPPLERQERFLDLAKAIRRDVMRMNASANQLASLFSSLQSRAFSGQL